MNRLISFFIVLLVCFHVLETDGPCDFEEHFAETVSSTSSHSQVSPAPIESHEQHGHKHIVPEHFGHSAVVLVDCFEFSVQLNSVLVQFSQRPNGKIRHFGSENFRPPLA